MKYLWLTHISTYEGKKHTQENKENGPCLALWLILFDLQSCKMWVWLYRQSWLCISTVLPTCTCMQEWAIIRIQWASYERKAARLCSFVANLLHGAGMLLASTGNRQFRLSNNKPRIWGYVHAWYTYALKVWMHYPSHLAYSRPINYTVGYTHITQMIIGI